LFSPIHVIGNSVLHEQAALHRHKKVVEREVNKRCLL